MRIAAPAGRIGVLGFSSTPSAIPQQELTKKELTLYASRLNCAMFPTVIDWIRSGLVDPGRIITHQVDFRDVDGRLRPRRAQPALTAARCCSTSAASDMSAGLRHRGHRRADGRVQPDRRRRRPPLPARLRRRHVQRGDRGGRQGARCAYVTRLGDDDFGRMCLELWRARGRRLARSRSIRGADRHLLRAPRSRRHSFSYLRSADRRPAACSRRTARGAAANTRSSMSRASARRSATRRPKRWARDCVAREAGAEVSYDPNLRLKLWSLERAREVIIATIPLCQHFLPSIDDVAALGARRAGRHHRLVSPHRAPNVVLKLGGEGCWSRTASAVRNRRRSRSTRSMRPEQATASTGRIWRAARPEPTSFPRRAGPVPRPRSRPLATALSIRCRLRAM